MEVKIYPPDKISDSPFNFEWYDLGVSQVTFDLSQRIHEYNITAKNKFTMTGYEHSTSKMKLTGVISENSDLPGSTIEDKRDNLIEAASGWWMFGDQKIQTDCAKIYWRGWEQYIMIEKLSIEKIAGETESYDYELEIIIHEGN